MTALIYMMTAIVLPGIPADQEIDLRDHYFREAPAFFGLGVAIVAWSLLREYMLEGQLPDLANSLFHAAFGAMALLAMLIRRPRLHETLAVLMSLLFAAYIALLFARLDI